LLYPSSRLQCVGSGTEFLYTPATRKAVKGPKERGFKKEPDPTNRNKKFWEELIVYFPLIRNGLKRKQNKIRGAHRHTDNNVIS
jgi:hypothetical protein